MQVWDQVYQLIRARHDSSLSNAERQAAEEKMRLLDQRRQRRQPTDRHEERMRAFYVDLADGGVWLRPCDLDPQDCADEVLNAINDCNNARLRIEEAALVHGNHQLAEAVAALAYRTTFPLIPQPSMGALLPSPKKKS
jgi:hypothetical protein